jgi:hypothetical protein
MMVCLYTYVIEGSDAAMPGGRLPLWGSTGNVGLAYCNTGLETSVFLRRALCLIRE